MSYAGSQGHFLQPDSLTARGILNNQLDPAFLMLGSKLSDPCRAGSSFNHLLH